MQSLFIVLLICSMPFIAVGVGLTLRRLRDVGWPASLVSLFFIPFVNAVFFGLLCVQPGRQHSSSSEVKRSWLRRIMQTDKAFTAALLGISASSILGVGLTAFGALFLQNYGWGLFVGIPFMMGLLSALIYSETHLRPMYQRGHSLSASHGSVIHRVGH